MYFFLDYLIYLIIKTGLTSFGYGCGDGGVVTRIANYHNWILGKIQ